jgi:hypothetical protein
MIEWIYFPKSNEPPPLIRNVVKVFENVGSEINSNFNALKSNEVLSKVGPGLDSLGFKVEKGKKFNEKIFVPVLFGRNGKPEKSFDADAYHETEKIVLEVEAGRGVLNNQFLKDLFQACMMNNVDYCGIAIRNIYKGNPDFEQVVMFFETLYASNRLILPLKGIFIVGY